MKIIAAFFEVNDDTNTEAFGEWLDTCTFSNSVTVDYAYNPTAVPAGTAEVEVDTLSASQLGTVSIPAPATLMDDSGNAADTSTADQATSSLTEGGSQAEATTETQATEADSDAPNVDDIAEGDVSEVTEAEAEKAVEQSTADEPAEEQKPQE